MNKKRISKLCDIIVNEYTLLEQELFIEREVTRKALDKIVKLEKQLQEKENK